MFAARLSVETYFSHITAARLMGGPIPWNLERRSSIEVSVPTPARAPHARGLVGRQARIIPAHIVVKEDIRITSAARTWCDLATVLPMLDLVALGDYLIHWSLPLTSLDEIAACVDLMRGRRGHKRMAEAFPFLNDRAESPPESMTRVIFVRGGLPAIRVNREVIDTETGTVVRCDLVFDEFKVAVEYQGDYHRTKAQWRKDMTRRSRLEAKGWIVMEINWDDLADEADLLDRVRAALLKQGWRP